MAKFHGPVNLILGGEKPWAESEWDPETGSYVVDVTGENLKKFRAVADEYGFSEAKGSQDD
jgi:hypothetical protein